MIESRVKTNLKKKAYHNIILAVAGGIALLVLLFFFGTKLLIGFSLLTENDNGEETTKSTNQNTYVAPPVLNPIPDATNKDSIALSGKGIAYERVKLYVNDSLVDDTTVQDDENFKFGSVRLSEGQNIIKAITVTKDNKKSVYSKEVTISYLKEPPELTVSQPQDGQSFNKSAGPVSIQGQTDPGAEVTVNEFIAVVDDSGKFSYLYNLKDGDNPLKIEAKDKAGNKTTKELTIRPN